jgi:hypothetical protein
MGRSLIKLGILTGLIMILSAVPALAAKPASAKPTGNDISWPQCGKTVPSGQAFGIVGVNGGLATTTNPCLKDQLLWATTSTGSISTQPKIQLYVNTANPGELIGQITTWPTNNIDMTGILAPNPYGSCDGQNTQACSWQYGWNRAVEDVWNRFLPAAQSAGINTDPDAYNWWLDVETENTWQSGSAEALARNVADLEGMTAYFQSRSGRVGIYSTAYQWGQIVGNSVETNSNLNQLPSWLAGARNRKDAQSKCSLASLTTGGSVVLTQYVANNLDYDNSCI